jgi:hypothetical protein
MTYTKDCSLKSNRTSDQIAQKTLVASFPGMGFVAEREDDALNVYLVSGDGVQTGAIVADRAARGGMTAAKMQAAIVARRKAGRL